MRSMTWLLPLAVLSVTPGATGGQDLSFEDRVELLRGLTAEYATAKAMLPRSKKPLPVDSMGIYDKEKWDEVAKEFGPAARVGDLVQITKVTLEGDRIEFEINGGWKGGRKWYERIQVGVGSRTTPISSGSYSMAPSGTKIALLFNKKLPALKSGDVKEILAPLLDFNMRSATEHYVETLPPEIRAAVEEKRAVEGMDKDQVLLALGQPKHKVRETKDGQELEDWVYGTPPGRIIFVTFHDNKVIRVKETYAGLGGEVAPPLQTPR
jgi:hypothetical protein